MLALAITNLTSMMSNKMLISSNALSSHNKPVLFLLALTLLTFIPLLLKLDLPDLPHDVYLPLHTSLEVIAVVIAALIFAVIREQALVQMTIRGAVIACAFFAVFWLDLAHLLSYQGMPAYFTVNDAEKAVNFWLAARVIAAAALCFVALTVLTFELVNVSLKGWVVIMFLQFVTHFILTRVSHNLVEPFDGVKHHLFR